MWANDWRPDGDPESTGHSLTCPQFLKWHFWHRQTQQDCQTCLSGGSQEQGWWWAAFSYPSDSKYYWGARGCRLLWLLEIRLWDDIQYTSQRHYLSTVIPPLTLKESRNVELLNISSPHLHIHSLFDISSFGQCVFQQVNVFVGLSKLLFKWFCLFSHLFIPIFPIRRRRHGMHKAKVGNNNIRTITTIPKCTSLPFAKWHVAMNSILFHFHYIVLWI